MVLRAYNGGLLQVCGTLIWTNGRRIWLHHWLNVFKSPLIVVSADNKELTPLHPCHHHHAPMLIRCVSAGLLPILLSLFRSVFHIKARECELDCVVSQLKAFSGFPVPFRWKPMFLMGPPMPLASWPLLPILYWSFSYPSLPQPYWLLLIFSDPQCIYTYCSFFHSFPTHLSHFMSPPGRLS